MFAAVHKDVSA